MAGFAFAAKVRFPPFNPSPRSQLKAQQCSKCKVIWER
jgi:hypothetical protein